MADQVIHYFQHTDGGGVHGFTMPLHREIAKQVRAGKLQRVVGPGDLGDPAEQIAQLQAVVAQLQAQLGTGSGAPGDGGLADTPTAGAPVEDDLADEDDDDVEVDEDVAGVHICEVCGDPVDRVSNNGPWPKKHKGCR